MVLNHVAAIMLFSGPLFYLGFFMAVDPAGVVKALRWFGLCFRKLLRPASGVTLEAPVALEGEAVPRKVRKALRLAGVALLLFAIVT